MLVEGSSVPGIPCICHLDSRHATSAPLQHWLQAATSALAKLGCMLCGSCLHAYNVSESFDADDGAQQAAVVGVL